MTATNATDPTIEPAARDLTIREAAIATGANNRSIRRRLASGAFPGAYKDADAEQPGVLVWRIPVGDLEAAGLGPIDLTRDDTTTFGPLVALTPTAATLIGTDRFARLRSELAEAVASAELALLRAEAEKWRAVAEERGQALDRADVALHTLSSALAAPVPQAPATTTPAAAPEPAVDTAVDSDGDATPVPPHVRSEAVLYAESMAARRSPSPARRSWWRRRR